MKITIHKITPFEVDSLQQLSIETFTDTFAADNTPENLQLYLQEAYTTEKLLAELENLNSTFYFVEVDQKLAGYLKLNVGAAQTEVEGTNAMEVERIYIRSSFQHHGLGKQFIQLAEKSARAAGKTELWLGVWEHNENAKAFYEKMGFKHIGAHHFMMGTDPQTDLILLKQLV